jgi:hypothetical protein
MYSITFLFFKVLYLLFWAFKLLISPLHFSSALQTLKIHILTEEIGKLKSGKYKKNQAATSIVEIESVRQLSFV